VSGGPPVLFISGFHRSGTTLVTSAVTDAIGGVTTTVGVLAEHIPTLRRLLDDLPDRAVDRGVDRLRIGPSTPEEYGFLLHQHTGKLGTYDHPGGLRLLRDHVAELAAGQPGATVVLKNPWDLGHEARLLADFPEARMILLRRRLADIERSASSALLRSTSSDYFRALDGDSESYRRLQRQLASRWKRPLLLELLRLAMRRQAYRLAGSVRELPADRVAFLSYDELRAGPERGAGWAAHLLDSQALASALKRNEFAERERPARSSAVHRALDRRWKLAWDEARATQVARGVMEPPLALLGKAA
jgi:sulfotransferase family protein